MTSGDRFNADHLGLSLTQAERLYFQIRLIREFETTLLDLFSQNAVFGTTHTCLGQEANAVAIMEALDRNIDTVWSNHRCHGHFLAYCGKVAELFAEIMGRELGVCAGRGGSQHICWHRFHSNGVQGGIVPLALGTAMAGKAEGAVTVVFLGDGTLGQGVVYECLNLAALWQLPVLFVLEDNGVAQTTPSELVFSGNAQARAEAFGLESAYSDTSEVMALHATASDLISRIRNGGSPCFWHIRSVRLGPHSKGDDTRSPEQMAALQQRDPVRLNERLVDTPLRLEQRCKTIIREALAQAEASPVNDGSLTA